jgi:ribosomal protein S18 acetylase RimI-like enzyme
MQITVREAFPEDAQTMAAILAESWKAAYVGMVPQDYLDSLTGSKWGRLTGDMSTGKLNAFLLLEDGVPAGAVGYAKSRDESLADWGEIQFLYVKPGFCRRGYGEKLFRAAVEALKRLGFENCFLWVLKENRNAREFYSSIGFRETDDITHSEVMGKRLTEVRYCSPAK